MPRDGSADATLIRQVADGDREAFRELFEAYKEPVFRFLAKLVGDRALAQDLTNEAMISVWRGAGSFAGRSSPSSWIFGIARNKALSELRRRRPEALDDDDALRLADPGPTPHQAAEQADLAQRIRALLDRLPAQYREVMQLAHYHELSIREISEVVGIPEATVKTRIFRARRQMEQLLREAGITGVGS